jgi:hypothetical protein
MFSYQMYLMALAQQQQQQQQQGGMRGPPPRPMGYYPAGPFGFPPMPPPNGRFAFPSALLGGRPPLAPQHQYASNGVPPPPPPPPPPPTALNGSMLNGGMPSPWGGGDVYSMGPTGNSPHPRSGGKRHSNARITVSSKELLSPHVPPMTVSSHYIQHSFLSPLGHSEQIGPNGKPILNARQRRTLRRAQVCVSSPGLCRAQVCDEPRCVSRPVAPGCLLHVPSPPTPPTPPTLLEGARHEGSAGGPFPPDRKSVV